jgi:hypothetical protein
VKIGGHFALVASRTVMQRRKNSYISEHVVNFYESLFLEPL